LTFDPAITGHVNGLTAPTPKPDELVLNLTDAVEDLALDPDTETTLIPKLDQALGAIDVDKPDKAITKLEQFIKQVNKERGDTLTDEEADALIKVAENAIATL
jgi:hypothetical protein